MNDDNRRRSKRLRLMAPMSPPVVPPSLAEINALDATIVHVEQFLCIEDTINLSKTCHAIRNILVHNPNGAFPKIKVSHFEVVDVTAAVATAAPTLPPHRRINNFVSNALAKIHFPTLQRLVIKFSKAKGKVHRGGNWADELRDSFIYMALGLERAVNLEELIVDFTPFLMDKSSLLTQNNFDTLSANLCRCIKLKRLNVINRADFKTKAWRHHELGIYYSIYSPALLAAFIPAIERGVSTIEGISFDFGENRPLSRSINNGNAISQSRDLFRRILLCNKLKELSLIFKGNGVKIFLGDGVHHSPSLLINSFLQACRDVHSEMEGNLPSISSMEKLNVKCEEVKVGRGESGEPVKVPTPLKLDDSSVAPFMDMISKQGSLDLSNVFMNSLYRVF